MYFVVALLFIAFAIAAFVQTIRRPGIFTMFVATMGLFSVGYYALPLFVPELSSLRSVPTGEIDAVAGMALLYVSCVVMGIIIVARRVDRLPRLRLGQIDRLFARHWWLSTLLAAAIYLGYILTNSLAYATEDLDGTMERSAAGAGLLGFLSGLALSILCLNLAIALAQKRTGAVAGLLLLFGFIEFRLAGGAQRLLFITPIFMIFVSLVGLKLFRLAASVLGTGVLALLLISPFAVALREARSGDHLRQAQAVTVSYNQGFLTTTLQSIVDRSDLIYNMTYLKPYVDQHGYFGAQYYASILAIPVPRILWGNKPYALSDNGQPSGETSILAWKIIVGNGIGSLTAFGPIVAYREGGWPAIIIDGVAAGILFALCLGIFGRSGYTGRLFLPIAFVNFTVSKVPTSLFEAVAQIMTYLPIVLGLFLLESILRALLRPASAPMTAASSLERTPVTRTPVSS